MYHRGMGALHVPPNFTQAGMAVFVCQMEKDKPSFRVSAVTLRVRDIQSGSRFDCFF
jgi:hypothetical protein